MGEIVAQQAWYTCGRVSMNNPALFLKKFLRYGTTIASVAPSSVWLSRATISTIDWSCPRIILELGAGTGPITAEILKKATPESRVIAVEQDADFAAHLRVRFSRYKNLEIIHGDVSELARYLKGRGIDKVDYIISGLPVPSFTGEAQQALFRSVRAVLKQDGSFNQITEFPLLYKRIYKKWFKDVRFIFEPRNIPPAGVYICRNMQEP
ncbi:MAG: phospholipid N-methyltransferase [Parcubacteria group bacterium Gr01-1014_8]|nr:MAG: phospholipid N-methyltransferase [Parcubacteria group bacterium Gr01-1014_8]